MQVMPKPYFKEGYLYYAGLDGKCNFVSIKGKL